MMIRTQCIALILACSSLFILPQTTFAQEQPTAEQLKLRKNKVIYKTKVLDFYLNDEFAMEEDILNLMIIKLFWFEMSPILMTKLFVTQVMKI